MAAYRTAALMGEELGWDEARVTEEARRYEELVKSER
jgi:hypothetical protein